MKSSDAFGHREIELKRLLRGENAGEKLIAALGGSVRREKRQVNHVFDTEDLRLADKHYAVRARIENGDAFLTVKGPSRSVSSSTGSKVEAEAAIEQGLASDVLAGRADPVTSLRQRLTDPAYDELWRGLDQVRAGRPLRHIGQFENLRRTVPSVLPSGLEISVEVDRTRFPDGRVEDEVEIEIPSDDVADEVEAWLDATARAAGVDTAPSTPKVVRFLSALRSPK